MRSACGRRAADIVGESGWRSPSTAAVRCRFKYNCTPLAAATLGLNPIEGGRLNVCGLLRTPGRSQKSSDPLQILLEGKDANTLLQNCLKSIVINSFSMATAAGLDFGRRRHSDNALTVGDAAGSPVAML